MFLRLPRMLFVLKDVSDVLICC